MRNNGRIVDDLDVIHLKYFEKNGIKKVITDPSLTSKDLGKYFVKGNKFYECKQEGSSYVLSPIDVQDLDANKVDKLTDADKLYGTKANGGTVEQTGYGLKTSLSNDYYFSWIKDSTIKYTKQITDGMSITVYTITITDGKVTAITTSETGTIANEKLTIGSDEYSRNVTKDGFYVINDTEKLIAISALADIMDKVDNVTIERNSTTKKLLVKDKGLDVEKFKDSALKKGTSNNDKITTQGYVDDEISKVKDMALTFTGYISTTEPSSANKGELWYSSDTLPTTFPIQVKTYSGSAWSSTTSDYTPKNFDGWNLVSSDIGYYWFGSKWKPIEVNTLVDNETIEYNSQSQLAIKNRAVSYDKLKSELLTDVVTDYLMYGWSNETEGDVYTWSTGSSGSGLPVYSLSQTSARSILTELTEDGGSVTDNILTYDGNQYTRNESLDGFYDNDDNKKLPTLFLANKMVKTLAKGSGSSLTEATNAQIDAMWV